MNRPLIVMNSFYAHVIANYTIKTWGMTLYTYASAFPCDILEV